MINARNPVLPVLMGLMLGGNAYAALPVIPGASGFGIETPAGRGGKIFRVTNLAETGAGSLAECVAASGPRVCIFETSGVIRLTQNLSIRNPNITIAGQTAPAPGIMLRGATLGIYASDVLVQHIAIRPGDDPTGPSPSSRDAMTLYTSSGIRNVVVDHCSMSWSIDETLGLQGPMENVTFSNNIFSEPLNESIHPKGAHAFAVLISGGARRVSMIGNLFAHATDRNPHSRADELAFVNNVVYNQYYGGMRLAGFGSPTRSSVVGNVYIKGPDSHSKAPTVMLIGGTSEPLVSGSQVFLRDNIGYKPDGTPGSDDPWSIVKNEGSLTRSSLEVNSSPSWPSGLVARSASNGEAVKHVMANVGTRPAQRDPVDARVVGHVTNRTGQIVNCVVPDGSSRCSKNAGGWPAYPQNTRNLSPPTNPHSDDNGDGYTNLENWLHKMAAEVEGRSTVAPPNPPAVSVD